MTEHQPPTSSADDAQSDPHAVLDRYRVDPEVSTRQCMGAGFERRENNDRRAAAVMAGKLTLAPHPLWETEGVTDWSADPFSSRNWQFQFHALCWLSPVRFQAFDGSEDARQFWLSTVRSWIQNNHPDNPPSKFSWVDMADGLRAQELVFGWPLAQTDEERAMLVAALELHGNWLADPANQSKANHALHQNVGLFVLSSFLGHGPWQDLSVQRLYDLFELSFDENGANDEGSIDYHRMNIAWWQKTWKRVQLENREVPAGVSEKLALAATFLAHATRPDGTMVPIGDTHLREVTTMGFPELDYVASKGRVGTPPSTTAVAASHGYVMGRSGWGHDIDTFAAQSHYSLRFGRAYSAHHHEDRGGLTYFAEGIDWISDPGSYLYEPHDPFRRYLRSREGHNLLIVQDREYDKNGQVPLKNVAFTDLFHDMTVQDNNYQGTSLTRRFVYFPTLDVAVVMDSFQAEKPVTVSQVWHTDQHIKPRYRDSALELQHAGGNRVTVNWLGSGALPKVAYAQQDKPQNWVSRKWGMKDPAAGFHVEQTARRGHFTTVFAPSSSDAWSVVSSRAKQDSLWLRLARHGAVWNITIDADGVTMAQDRSAAGDSPHHAAVVSSTTDAVLSERLNTVEGRLASLSAVVSQPAATPVVDNSLRTELTDAQEALKKLTAARKNDRELAMRQTAALLPLLPPAVPRGALLAGESFADYVPFISDPLYLHEQWRHRTDAVPLTLTQRRRLSKDLYARGYYQRSLEVLISVLNATGKDQDARVVEIRTSELAMMLGEVELHCEASESFAPETGRILHVVGKAIPETQTGYTLRTHYLAQAQVAKGYDVHAFRQAGGVSEPSPEATVAQDGVTYHLPEGPPRGTLPWDQWLQLNVDALAEHVRELRPSVLHCHSDFVNQMIAQPVAEAFGIPLVYESRGFWEESWLSRIETKAERDLTPDYERYGMPEAYSLRREREDQARAQADQVTTLAEVMKEHITGRGEDAARVSVTPNGVQPEEFPVVEPDLELKDRLGIPREDTVIGYITSVVEYEGIDTLISAFKSVRSGHPNAWLVLVGDGPVRKSLQLQAKNLGLENRVIFTGRVPHEDVLSYYSLIDLFVVPRKDRTVCRLVTPLKPFEAFSTGRAVVVSDVDALKEIADQSGAAATFRASDAGDLARTIDDLLADPDRRAEMAATGAAWVRESRSWGAIADLYDAPYERVGVQVFAPVDSTDPLDLDISALRAAWAQLNRDEAVQYLTLHSDESRKDPVPIADAIISDGWGGHGFAAVDLPEDFDWMAISAGDRTWQMHLHSWEFVNPVLEAWKVTGDDHYLLWCVQRALRWGETFTEIDTSSMAWYDMALAYRSVALQGLVRAASSCSLVTDQEIQHLLVLALRQRDAHWQAESFNARNNHGYYSAVSQLVLARALPQLPGMQALRTQGDARLRVMTASQFLPDGGHAEHSPDYHRMLLTSFEGAIRVGAIDDPEVLALIAKAADVLGWMVVPHGRILQMGDSPERRMNDGRTSYSPTTQWVFSNGARGQAPESATMWLPDSGYAFVRSLENGDSAGQRASYLAFSAGFHSRTHKHCDDQSLVWFESGQEILIDGGRYRYGELLPQDSPLRSDGFYYADPIRQYMESCAAHSTVSVDGQLHDRRRTPYGSGITDVEELDGGGYRLLSHVPHSGWDSQRTVTYHPGHSLVIEDVVTADDDDVHTLHSWFLLDGGLSLTGGELQGEDIVEGDLTVTSPRWNAPLVVRRSSQEAESLTVRSDRTGETMGEVLGVRSREDRKLEAAWSLHWEQQFTGEVRTRTEFTFQAVETAEIETPAEQVNLS